MRDLTLALIDVNAKIHCSAMLCYLLSRNATFQWAEELNFERGPNPGNSSGQHRACYHWNVSLQSTMLVCAFWAPRANRNKCSFLSRVACRFTVISASLSEVCPVISSSFKLLVMCSGRWAVFYETNSFCWNFKGNSNISLKYCDFCYS